MYRRNKCTRTPEIRTVNGQNLKSPLIFHGLLGNGISFSLSPLSHSLCVSLSSCLPCRSAPAQSLSRLLLRSPHSICSSTSTLPASRHPVSFSLSRWPSFWAETTCHLFRASSSRIAESFSMEPWIMFIGRNDKECCLAAERHAVTCTGSG